MLLLLTRLSGSNSGARSSLPHTQQMTMTSTLGTATAVVVIPEFPTESIILGIVLGLIVLSLVRLQWNPMSRRIRPQPPSEA